MPEIDQALLKQLRDKAASAPSPAVLAYEKEITQKNKQFRQPVPAAPAQTPGALQSIEKTERGAILKMERGYIKLAFLLPDLLQVRVRPDNQFGDDLIPFSYAIATTDWAEVEPVILEDPAAVVIGAGGMAVQVQRATGHFSMIATDRSVILDNTDDGFQWAGQTVRWTRRLPEKETCYGLGERASKLNLRGQRLQFWNSDPVLYQRGDDPIYYSIPFYMGFQEKYFVGVLWDNPARGSVDLGKAQADQLTFEAEAGELRFYVTSAITPDLVLDRYTTLTGRPFLPPLWALGYHQSRWGYENAARFLSVSREFRQRQIPCDVLYFDIDYMDQFCCFTWDQQRFAALPDLLKQLRDKGFKTIAILDPGIKLESPLVEEGKAQDVFMKYPDGELYKAVVWAGTSAFPDFTNPKVREWWAQKVAGFLGDTPFDGLWNDMNEPVVFTTGKNDAAVPHSFPDYLQHDFEGQPRSHQAGGHNVYGMQMARATRDGLEKAYPGKRPFTLTRAGYAGTQRYASSWTGDNLATWDHLKLSIPMLLNLGLSGIPFTGPDIGGFGGHSEGELFTRWMQLGSVLPYFRTHAERNSSEQEPWSFGTQYERIIKHYIELRYRLLPYLYSVMAISHQQGLPFVRPTFFVDRTDDQLREQDDAFMVGDSLFVAPILEQGATQRTIYLPRGVWYEFWTNRLIDGSREITVNAPLEIMPMFFRAGRVLPLWHVQQYVGEKPLEELILRLYAGPGESTYYEDAGEGREYEQGEYRFSYFTAAFFPNGQFGVDWRTAGKYQPPYKRVRVEVIGIPGEPEEIQIDKRPAPLWFFENGVVEVVAEPFKELRLIGRRADTAGAARTAIRKPT